MPLPNAFIQHLRNEGYHPRSDKHSNALAVAVVDDLLTTCPPLAARAKAGEVVYDLNFDLIFTTATWNVDLVLGSPPYGFTKTNGSAAIARATPSTVEIAIEVKGVMTAHRKAVKNRKRDLEAHHAHVHNYSYKAIAGGIFVINAAGRFKSPLKAVVSTHRNPEALVAHCVNELRAVATRSGSSGTGMEAKTALVVATDNLDLDAAHYVTKPPAPQVGDPLHYDAFLQKICTEYSARFG